jgi:putative endonuclease
MQNERQSFVYILGNWTGAVLYTGVTADLKRRVYEHRSKRVKGFTYKYNVDRLLYYETFADIRDAIGREKQLKAGPRRKKVALINAFNPTWSDLYDKV